MADQTIQQSLCKTCNRLLPASAFYRSKASKSGLQYQCKPCSRAYLIAWHAKRRVEKPHIIAPPLPGEVWRDVPGYEGYYSVSNHGRVRSERAATNSAPGRIIKLRDDGRGYLYLTLSKSGKARTVRAHALVAAAFIGPRPDGLFVNHIDGNKQNNRVENLEYVTCRENMEHASRTGLMSRGEQHGQLVRARTARGGAHYARQRPELVNRGERHGGAKLTAEAVTQIRSLVADGASHIELAKQFHVDPSTISDIKRRKIWRHVP
ncbi:MAG TPA: HNH endonuclease [Pyrinomonadaceae bacterium]|nr:HNH endonuclease [Pyrinomonadaceae bacterium]